MTDVSHYFVCFHAGRSIGEYGSLRSAVLGAELAACDRLRGGRQQAVNIYPVDHEGRKGLRVARVTPYRLSGGTLTASVAYGEAARV